MIEFNILEIQRNIEEKRLIWGKKLENFLSSKLQIFLRKSDAFLKSKNCAFYLVFFSFFVSIFLRSHFDIGANSAYFLAKNGIDFFVIVEVFMNLLGLVSIFLSNFILSKSSLKIQQRNLVILAFSLSFFLNKSFLPNNEFITSANFLLLFLFPFSSFLFVILSLTSFIPSFNSFIPSFTSVILSVSEGSQAKSFKITKWTSILIPASLIILIPDNLKIIPASLSFTFLSAALIQIFYNFISSEKFNFFKNKFTLSLILIFPLLDAASFLQLKEFIIFWWIALPIITFFLYKKILHEFPQSKEELKNTTSKAVYFLIFCFILFLQIMQKNQSFLLVFSILVSLIFLIFYEKTYQKFYQNFSAFFAITIFFLFSNLSSSYIAAIKQSYKFETQFKSPNFLSENIIRYSKQNLKNIDDEMLILSPNLEHVFPTLNYLEKTNKAFIYKDLKGYSNSSFLKIAESFKNHIFDKNVKILFINNFYDGCHIGFLEYYFRDKNFRKLFFQNYQFSKRIFASEVLFEEKKVEFFDIQKDVFDEANLEKSQLLYDFSFYVRK